MQWIEFAVDLNVRSKTMLYNILILSKDLLDERCSLRSPPPPKKKEENNISLKKRN